MAAGTAQAETAAVEIITILGFSYILLVNLPHVSFPFPRTL